MVLGRFRTHDAPATQTLDYAVRLALTCSRSFKPGEPRMTSFGRLSRIAAFRVPMALGPEADVHDDANQCRQPEPSGRSGVQRIARIGVK